MEIISPIWSISARTKPTSSTLLIDGVGAASAGIPCQQSFAEPSGAVGIDGKKHLAISKPIHQRIFLLVGAVAAAAMKIDNDRNVALSGARRNMNDGATFALVIVTVIA